MIDAKTSLRSTLTGSATLTALVPTTRITPAWLTNTTTLPCVIYRIENQIRQPPDYYDNVPRSETALARIDIFQDANKSPFAIESAIDTAMVAARWNLESRTDVLDDTGKVHVSMLYSQRLFTQ